MYVSEQEAGSGASCMALAVIINTFLLPAHVLAAVKLAPRAGAKATEWERDYIVWVTEMERKQKIKDKN
jgi:hypothetical protein